MDHEHGQPLHLFLLEERLERYRQFAAEARRTAAAAQDIDLRAGHLAMAEGWQALAEEIEKVRDRLGTMHGAIESARSKAKRPPN